MSAGTAPKGAIRYRAILNPAAGGGRCGRRFDALRPRLAERLESEHHTRYPGHAAELARRAVEDGMTHLLAIGGDGTALEVLNGALGRRGLDDSERLTLSVIPLGTGNSLVRHFAPQGRSLDDYAAESLLADRRSACDVLVVRHLAEGAERSRFALSSVTFGLPTRVADFVNRRLKPLGIVGYSISVVLELLGLRHESYDGSTSPAGDVPGSCWMLCCQNTETVGGAMRLAPGAEVDDGLLELVWGERSGRLSLIRAFPRIFEGTHVTHPAFRQRRVESYAFDAPMRRPVMLDGEVEELAVRSVSVLSGVLDLAL